jgi:hypothetical protein
MLIKTMIEKTAAHQRDFLTMKILKPLVNGISWKPDKGKADEREKI